MVDDVPRDLEVYAEGRVRMLDADAVAAAARALACWDGDSRLYEHDPDAREGFAASVRLVVGIYLERAAGS